jgi:hypothetical protein
MSNHLQNEARPRLQGGTGFRGGSMALIATLFAALFAAACHAPPPRVTTQSAVPPQSTHEPEDPTFDWHVLVVAPFGSLLKGVPLQLHEVLLFRDEAQSTAPADDAECYATGTAAPRFIGRTPDEFLLCFKQDRLSRIQATVRLTAAQAPDVFAAACAGWMKKAQSAGEPAGPACEGHDGAIRFSGHLEEDPSQTDTDLIVVLDSPPSP